MLAAKENSSLPVFVTNAYDENGRLINGDLILYICGKYLKNKGQLEKNTVVTTIMSNIGLYKAFDSEEISYEKTSVGDKYVYENMSANGYKLGGEESGHIIFGKYASTGDGILTSLMIMEVVLESKMSLAKLAEPVTIFPQLLKNVRVTDKNDTMNDADVLASVKKVEEALGNNGRILVREKRKRNRTSCKSNGRSRIG